MNQIRTDISCIPIELKRAKQWLVYDENKRPISAATGQRKNWQNNLTDFETAKRYAEQHGLGIGFAFNGQTEFLSLIHI